MADSPTIDVARARSSKRRWGFRIAAVVVGLAFFVVVEFVCWAFDWGSPENYDDPFVGFSELQPLFALDDETQTYRIPKSKLRFFASESFSANKRAGSLRVFCLGGSTVRGRPFSIETSFSSWLEIAMDHAEPNRDHEVINCGGVSYASYRLVPILEECLKYKPDLFVICTGHNEFLEDRTYQDVKQASRLIAIPHRNLARLRSYHFFRSALLSLTGSETPDQSDDLSSRSSAKLSMMKSDVDAFLDYRRGLEAYHRDETWRAGVIRHFGFNLNRMLQICQQNGVPVVLVLPPSNLADSMPFKSEHKRGLSDDKQGASQGTDRESSLKRWESIVSRARQASKTSALEAIRLFEQSLQIDDEFAAIHFQLGELYERTGQLKKAKAEFLLAREHDICPLRIVSSMEQAIRDAGDTWNVPVLDAHQLLESSNASGTSSKETEHSTNILGASELVDHVHPSIAGHQLIAERLAEMMIRSGWIEADKTDWLTTARRAFAEHFNRLPGLYFQRGHQNLENLRYWTRGETDGPDIGERIPHPAN